MNILLSTVVNINKNIFRRWDLPINRTKYLIKIITSTEILRRENLRIGLQNRKNL